MSMFITCDPSMQAEVVKGEIVRQAEELGLDPTMPLKIAKAESRYIIRAVNNKNKNGSNDKGVFQINSIHNLTDECRLNLYCNVKWSLEKMKKEGYGAWYSSEHKWK